MWNVLIVDDEPKIRRGLRKWVEEFNLGYNVIGEAKDHKEAFEIAEKENIDVFLMDINMPGINGLDITSKLKVKFPKSYTIIISGYDDFEYAHQALKLQVYDYLLKPIPKTDLYNVLDNLRKTLLEEENKVEEIDSNLSGIVQRVKEYIDENYSDPDLSLTKVSNLFNINKTYLSKLMKEELGDSFTEYLTEIRLLRAKEILADRNSYPNILEVAIKVGFKTQHYFSRVFKKYEGISPLEYRNKYSN